MKNFKRIFIGSILITGGIFLARIPGCLESAFGRSYSQTSPEDVRELRRLSYLALPAIHALETEKDQTGVYPESLTSLEAMLPPGYLEDVFWEQGAPYPSFKYFPVEDGASFRLYMKTNWEGSLWYYGEGRWTYRQDMEEWDLFH